jgi:hypothetical protein
MKKQLQMLKSMELDMSESDPIGEKTVLKLLKEKSRRLETESIQLKVRPIPEPRFVSSLLSTETE